MEQERHRGVRLHVLVGGRQCFKFNLLCSLCQASIDCFSTYSRFPSIHWVSSRTGPVYPNSLSVLRNANVSNEPPPSGFRSLRPVRTGNSSVPTTPTALSRGIALARNGR